MRINPIVKKNHFQKGAGKSATGNLLIGEKVFEENDMTESKTEVIQHRKIEVSTRSDGEWDFGRVNLVMK